MYRLCDIDVKLEMEYLMSALNNHTGKFNNLRVVMTNILEQSTKQMKVILWLDQHFTLYNGILTSFLTSPIPSHFPPISPPPLMQHATKSLHDRLCCSRMSQVCVQYIFTVKMLQSHVCEHRLSLDPWPNKSGVWLWCLSFYDF